MKKTKIYSILAIISVITIITAMGVIAPAQASSPTGLVGRWHLDEGIGSTATDSSGNANDGTLSGGKFGNALIFDGIGDYVEIPYDLSFSSAFTIEAWIYPTASGQFQMIVTKDTSSYYTNYNLQITSADKLRFYVSGLTLGTVSAGTGYINGVGIAIDGATTIIPNSWYHVAGVYTGTDIQVYLDGSLDGSAEVTGTPTTNAENVWIGKRKASVAFPFEGKIDEVRISNIGRSSFTTSSALTADGSTVALWHFDESVGTVAFDETTNYDGDIFGASWAGPTWTAGLFGDALLFDGVDDCVQIPHSASLDISGTGITLEAWVNAEAFPSGRVIDIAKQGAYALQIYQGKVRVYLGPGPTMYQTDSVVLSVDTWHHLAATYDGSYVRIYVDGVLEKEVSKTGNQAQSSNDVYIGNNQAQNGPFEGIIDEPRIWSRALSAEEIKMHAWGLVGEWDFNENSGSTAYDSSGFGNDGTLMNMDPGTDWVTGKVGYALDFDGDNDNVEVPDSASLDLSTEVTVEAWVKLDSYDSGEYLYTVTGKWNDRDGAYRGYLLCIRTGMEPRFYVSTDGVDFPAAVSTETLVTGQWYHLAGTFDGTEIKIFVDGIETGTATIGSSPLNTHDQPLLIGADRAGGGKGNFLDGQIDEVRVWNQALVPVKFDQTGLDSSATGELVVTVSDPIPLDYEDLPFVMMVPSGTEVDYEFEDPVPSSDLGTEFSLVDVTCGTEPDGTAIAPTTIIGNYFKTFTVSGYKYEYPGIFCDDFETYSEGAHPSGVGLGDWQYVSGNPSIVTDASTSSKVLAITGGSYVGEVAAVTGSSAWTDYVIELDVKKQSGNYYNIVFRYGDTNNYYLIEPSSDTLHLALFKRVGGVFTELAPRPLQSTNAGDWYNYRIEVTTTASGTNIKVFVDEVLKFDVTDDTPALATGAVGVGGYSGSEARFDNFCVSKPLNDWTIILSKDSVQVDSVDTGDGEWEDGYYEFTIRSPGEYSISEELKAGWTKLSPASDYIFTATSGHEDITGNDFVNFENVELIVRKVDTNGNPVPRWGLSLNGDRQVTDVDGYYTYVITAPGDYSLSEETRAGWTPQGPITVDFLNVKSGDEPLTHTFVNFENVELTVCKEDTEGNKISGWGVSLDGDRQITGERGCYKYIITAPGTYVLSEETREGWTPQGPTTVEFVRVTSGSGPLSHTFVNFEDIVVSGYKYEYIDSFCDDFSVGTLDDWDPVSGDSSWSIVGNTLVCNPAVTWPIIKHDVDFDDYVFEADARFVSGRGYALIFRVSDDFQRFYSFQYQVGTGYQLRLYQFTDFTAGADVAPQQYYNTDDEWHHIKVAVKGDNIKCYVDGVLIYDVVDSADPVLLTGEIGFRTWSSTTAEFDNVCVYDASTPLEDWTMRLYNDVSYVETETDANGYYEFIVTAPGDYSIKEDLPSGWTQIKPKNIVGSDDPDPNYVIGYEITAKSGVDIPCRDLWNFRWATIAGTKTEYGGEGLIGWTIKAVDGTNEYSDVTDEDGNYLIYVEKPGIYDIKEVLQDKWTQITPELAYSPGDGSTPSVLGYEDVPVASGAVITEKNFVNFEWATITGTKYDMGEGFCDDFEIYDIGSDGSPVWTADADAWTVIDSGEGYYGQVYQGHLEGRVFSNIDVETDAMMISVDVKGLTSDSPTNWANGFIIFDYVDSNNFKRAGLGIGDPRYIFDSFVDGSQTHIEISAPGISKDVWYNLKVEIDGNTVMLYVNGDFKAQHTFTDPIGNGKIGVQTGTAQTYFDNFCFRPKTQALEDWSFILCDADDNELEDFTTGPSGQYEFVIKDPGTYKVYEEVQDGWTLAYPNNVEDQYGPGEYLGYLETVESGDVITDRDFWNFEWTTISGMKFFDGDGDGINDCEPGLQYWEIELYKDGSVYGPDTTDEFGCYSIEIKDPGIYLIKEVEKAHWEQTTTDHIFTAVSGEGESYDFGNWLGPSEITTSNLCWFDTDAADGRQFRVIFTPDIENDASLYKVSATNPGQFYYNVFFTGEVTEDFVITLPETFETQGAMPVHVYSSVNTGPCGCLIPGEEIEAQIIVDGNEITVGLDEYTGFVYITVHCDYNLKQTGGYEQHFYEYDVDVWRAHAAIEGEIKIQDLANHLFKVEGQVDDTQIIQNSNEFKKFRGIVGFVGYEDGTAIPDIDVTIECKPLGITQPLKTDEDGFYGWDYFHLGKPREYTITLTVDGTLYTGTVTLKAGHFAEVSFTIPIPTP